MLHGQMSSLLLESVQDDGTFLLEFGQNQASNSWKIAEIEFV